MALLWVMAAAYLLLSYGLTLEVGALDAVISLLILALGAFILEKIFNFFTPTHRNWTVSILFPLGLSVFCAFLQQLISQLIFDADHEYMTFWQETMLLRGYIYFLILTALMGLQVYQMRLEAQLEVRKREEQTTQLAKEAELFRLKQQLQPHFLFNSLNSISALVKSDPDKARKMVLQLSDFLRNTIRKDDRAWLSVAEEVDYLKLFTEIEQVRFGHRLRVVFDVEEAVLGLQLPQLLIQPLLENAVKHSLYAILGEVTIQVIARKKLANLIIEIKNPFDPKAGQVSGSGFGLEAVKRRLYLLFGRHDLIEIKQNENEFEVKVIIPQAYV